MPAVSPSTLNYSVLKGICKFLPTGGSTWIDMGNAPEVELTPEIDKLDHFSSRAGVRSKDRSVVREKTLNLRIVLDEITPQGLQWALLGGDLVNDSDANQSFPIYENSEITGAFSFTGTNTVGSRVHLDLPSVSILPSGSIPFISEEWAQFELTMEVLFSEANNDFGTCLVEAQA